MKKLITIAALALAAGTAAAQTNDKGGHRGVDFGIGTGYSFYTGDNSGGEIPVELSLGKRFNKNFYWGISSGAVIPTGDGAKVQIPITTDFKVLFPLSSPTLTPGILLRAGYLINTAEDKEIKIGKKTEKITLPDHIMIQAMPTVDIALSKSVDFILGIGYTHYVPTKGSDSFGAVTLKTAFNFHKSTAISTVAREKAPTRDRGVEISGNLGGKYGFNDLISFMGDLGLMYKWNPNISVGIGGGYELITCETDVTSPSISATKLFLRGEYRLNDEKISPFGAVDLGMNMYTDMSEDGGDNIKMDKSAMFISPAVGLSFRTGNNSYFKVKLGYEITPKVKYAEYSSSSDYCISDDKIGVSGLFLNIGYTHTLNWGTNWFK